MLSGCDRGNIPSRIANRVGGPSEANLGAFLRAASRRLFAWGDFDCTTFVADWVLETTGRDPAARWRGTYASLIGATRIIRQNGGLVALFDVGLRGIGIDRTDVPQSGDIAVVDAVPHGPVGAILLTERTAVMLGGLGGIMLRRTDFAPIQAAWRIAWEPS